MINKLDLSDQQWYDGFIWKDGKQQGVTTLKWSGSLDLFYNPVLDPEHHYQHKGDNSQWGEFSFEPNVLSRNPHGQVRRGP